MIELAAFVHMESETAAMLPYHSLMRDAEADGLKDELFPEGWQDETEWVAAEVINDRTKELYRVTFYIARDPEVVPVDLIVFEPMFAAMAKDAITRYVLNNDTDFLNPNPHK